MARTAPQADARAPGRAGLDGRLVGAALACIERWGVAKTTLEDVAREAGCSRATVYRAFPGGKRALLQAVAASELAGLFDALSSSLEAAEDLEELLVAGISRAAGWLQGRCALKFLLAHEPELVLPRGQGSGLDGLLRLACDFAAPYLERYLGPDPARRAAEWVARLVVSYTTCPAEGFDLAEADSARQLVRLFVLPGVRAMSAGAGAAVPAGGQAGWAGEGR
jgi:AcrR family transcriptional regulator